MDNATVAAAIAANIDYRNRYYYFSKPSNIISFDSTDALYFHLP